MKDSEEFPEKSSAVQVPAEQEPPARPAAGASSRRPSGGSWFGAGDRGAPACRVDASGAAWWSGRHLDDAARLPTTGRCLADESVGAAGIAVTSLLLAGRTHEADGVGRLERRRRGDAGLAARLPVPLPPGGPRVDRLAEVTVSVLLRPTSLPPHRTSGGQASSCGVMSASGSFGTSAGRTYSTRLIIGFLRLPGGGVFCRCA